MADETDDFFAFIAVRLAGELGEAWEETDERVVYRRCADALERADMACANLLAIEAQDPEAAGYVEWRGLLDPAIAASRLIATERDDPDVHAAFTRAIAALVRWPIGGMFADEVPGSGDRVQ